MYKDKKIDGITDLNDHSRREGMRICIDLRKDANANVVLNLLYKHTQLQDTFGVNMLSLIRIMESTEGIKPETDAGILSGSSGRCSDQKNEI